MTDYDIVVLGGGSGTAVAVAAADRGLTAAVVEPGPLGGACITRGCVPSKALLHRAEIVETIREAEDFGIDAALRGVEYGTITESIHDAVFAKAADREATLDETENLRFYRGEGRFVDEREVAVEDETGRETARLRGEQIVVAIGSRPVSPPIDGLGGIDFLTSDDALYLEERPNSMVIVGGGYVGAELGSFFETMGTEVTIVGRSPRLLPREDDDVSEVITTAIDGRCTLYVGHEAVEVESVDDGRVVVTVASTDGADHGEETEELVADELLVAAGRRPNTDTLDLEYTDIETDDGGHVQVDERLETTADGIWALGDVVGRSPYKHTADAEARVVAGNALDGADSTPEYGTIPHAVFTLPQAASVGRTADELETEGTEYDVARVSYEAAPMGMIVGARDGFVKLLSAPGGEILGCHVVGPQASTMIHEVVVAMRAGFDVDDLLDTVHVHPAMNEVLLAAFEEAADPPYSTAPDWRDVASDG